MELASAAVGILIAWAAGNAGRLKRDFDGLSDHARERAVSRLHRLLDEKLGGEPPVARLVSESRENGDASSATRREAESCVRAALADDPGFAERFRSQLNDSGLRMEAPGSGNASGRAARTYAASNSGSGFSFAGDGNTVRSTVKTVHGVPVWLIALGVAALLALAYWGIAPLLSGAEEQPTGSSRLSGNWNASDNTVKLFGENGQCEGFYYSNGEPLDIGGPSQCAVSDAAGPDGRYRLTVIQSPNRSTYEVKFDGADHATVYAPDGQPLYEMDRL